MPPTTIVLALVLALLAVVPSAASAAPLRIGVQIAPENATYEEVVRTAALVEELGYDGLWLNDHLVPIKSRIQEFVDAGATAVILTTRPSLNHDLMRRFATEIAPAFRAAPASG